MKPSPTPISPGDYEDGVLDFWCAHYDDWFRPEIAPFVLGAVNGYESWEHETIIAAHAIYAESNLQVN